MYKTNSLYEYKSAMDLRKRFGWGSRRISSFLFNKGVNLKEGAISGWIYYNKRPFEEVIISKIPEESKFLTEEKAYILGVLCGDGYISTENRIGLSVCDKDFAEFFKLCLERVYCLQSTISSRRVRNPNARLQYVISLCSKRVVEDLHHYLASFKTKDWNVPSQIKSSNKHITAFYLRGLYDSEGSVRLRRNGYGIVQFYSSNINGVLGVEALLKNVFDINSKIVRRKNGMFILEITYYKDIIRFYREINFCMIRKQIKLFQMVTSYKRKGLRSYPKEFKLKVLNLLKSGYSAYRIGKILNFPHTNVYDFIKQAKRYGWINV